MITRNDAADGRPRWQDLDPTASVLLPSSLPDVLAELNRTQSVVQDLTSVIAANRARDLELAERIAARAGYLFDTDPSDMELDDLVDALLEEVAGRHLSAAVQAMEPDVDAVFFVLDADGRITGPVHPSEDKAREWAERMLKDRHGRQFTVVRRVATCNSRVLNEWKEG